MLLLLLQHKKLVSLSEQCLVDCSWGFGNNGCDGGESERAYKWIMKSGCLPTESSYGQYLMQVYGILYNYAETLHVFFIQHVYSFAGAKSTACN